jgi:hypothetical protein
MTSSVFAAAAPSPEGSVGNKNPTQKIPPKKTQKKPPKKPTKNVFLGFF